MMKYVITNNELYHFGIKGMRWGIRNAETRARYRRDGKLTVKQYKNERNNVYKKIRKDLEDNSEDGRRKKQLEEEAYKLARKYDFDGDDGGGGSTKADRQAGARYIKKLEQASYLSDALDTKATKKTTDFLIKKYGKEKIDRINRIQSVKTGALVLGGLASIYAVPVYLIWRDLH